MIFKLPFSYSKLAKTISFLFKLIDYVLFFFLTRRSKCKVLQTVAKDLTWLSNCQRIQPSRQLPPGASTVCLIITRLLREVTKPQTGENS